MYPDVASLVRRTGEHSSDVSIAVLGDYCLDLYLFIDSAHSEISLETGLPTRSVADHKTYAGGAGNVAANLASLGTGSVRAIGLIGDDMYGRELLRLLNGQGVNTDSLLVHDDGYVTHVYTKVYEGDTEDPRLDMGNYNTTSPEWEQKLLNAVKNELSHNDVFIVNQQVLSGIYSDTFVEGLVSLLETQTTTTVLVDSRSLAMRFPGTIRKINEDEARRYFLEVSGPAAKPDTDATVGVAAGAMAAATTGAVAAPAVDPSAASAVAAEHAPLEDVIRGLWERWKAPIVVTRGEDGAIVCTERSLTTIPGIQVQRPIDTVGAGDTLLAGTALGLATGLDLPSAVHVGNLAASVTVKKLKRTGVATPEEIFHAAEEGVFRFNPELAALPHHARYVDGTHIERITPITGPRQFRFAMFDHDGTISVLRQGWETVMVRMMVEVILGDYYHDAEPAVVESVSHAVETYITDTTGIQSIEQMHGLVGLIRQFGYVPENEIGDPFEYKALYLSRLDEMIWERLDLVKRGVLVIGDVTVKGALQALHHLRERGFTLFLASGSDHDAVVEEARILGYADLFDGGIFGSVDDIANDPKRVVLSQIMKTVGSDHAGELLTFGDGPVEIRETLRAGGVPIGLASDEIRRYGLNIDKRRRLILAGARYVIPDFREFPELLRVVTEGEVQ